MFHLPLLISFLTSSPIVDCLQEYARTVDTAIVLYFCFDVSYQRASKDGKIEMLVRCVLKQLSTQAFSKIVEELYDNRFTVTCGPRYIDTLEKFLNNFNEIFLIIDGVDECTEQQEILVFVQQLRDWEKNNLRIFLFNRQTINVEDPYCDHLCSYLELETSSTREDISMKRYHSWKIQVTYAKIWQSSSKFVKL